MAEISVTGINYNKLYQNVASWIVAYWDDDIEKLPVRLKPEPVDKEDFKDPYAIKVMVYIEKCQRWACIGWVSAKPVDGVKPNKVIHELLKEKRIKRAVLTEVEKSYDAEQGKVFYYAYLGIVEK